MESDLAWFLVCEPFLLRERVDAAVSTRLAGSSYTAPANSDVAAIKVKTDALNTERLANVATTAIVGNLIAQANS